MFRTLKYRPWYPNWPFQSLEEALAWVIAFVDWYNDEHLYSAIGFVKPNDRHAGQDVEILAQRREVYEQAKRGHSERWSRATRNWSRVEVVKFNPDAETKYADEDYDAAE